jgi:anti-sigma factor RsiW
MRGERRVGGLWCGEVLERLPDLLSDELDPDDLAAVRAHLEGCDACERFGGEYAATVAALRRELAAGEPLPRGFRESLAERLDRGD